MLNCFRAGQKLGNWYSTEDDWKIGIKLNKRYSWAVFYKDKIVKRGGGLTDLIKTVDIAYETAQALKVEGAKK